MARTKASVGAKLTSGKSSKAVKTSSVAPTRYNPSAPSTSKGSNGGNPYHPRPTPKWQKPITSFFGGGEASADGNSDDDEEIPSGSKNRPRHSRIINSDTESDCEGATEENNLNVSNMSCPPPSPDDSSHKIVEYFKNKDKTVGTTQSIKGKGKGKRSLQSNGSDDSTKITENHNGHSKESDNNKSKSENKENQSSSNVCLDSKNETNGKAGKRELENMETNSAKRVRTEV